MNITEELVKEVLKKIIHPEQNKDLVELGIVQDVKVGANEVSLNLKFNKVNDPLKNSLKRVCEDELHKAFGTKTEIKIELVTNLQVNKPKPEPKVNTFHNIIAVSSGKGGVGKSTVATNLAVALGITGAKVGLIDADIFGPSLPKMMGVENERPLVENVEGKELLVPVEAHGIKVLSIGFFIPADDATVWRGPMASNAFTQLIKDAKWGELDYLVVDLPPGTSDIHLTLVQTLSVNGAIIVSTPQNVALADAIKGISMFNNANINVPILGIIENMAWFTPEELPENKYYIFGKEGGKKLSEKLNVPLLGQIPIVQSICDNGDNGTPSVLTKDAVSEAFKKTAENIRTQLIKRNAEKAPTKVVEFNK